MPIRLMVLVRRKPTLSPAEFQQYYEENHVPLLKELFGPDWCKSHTRYFLQFSAEDANTAGGDGEKTIAPVVIVGDASTINYDSVAILEFEDEEALGRFQNRYREVQPRLKEDEAKFIGSITEKVFPVTGPNITTRD